MAQGVEAVLRFFLRRLFSDRLDFDYSVKTPASICISRKYLFMMLAWLATVPLPEGNTRS
jgi:hypothetical protein